MSWSPEFEPRRRESIPFELLYEAAISRLVEAVQRSDTSGDVRFWQLETETVIGVDEMPLHYARLRFVDDYNHMTSGLAYRAFEAWIPVSNADVTSPSFVPTEHPTSHLIVKVDASQSDKTEATIKVTPHSITAWGGNSEAIQGVGSTKDELSEMRLGVEMPEPSDENEYPDETDQRNSEWGLGLATKIGFYDLVPIRLRGL